jgi:hypothetical protein
MLNSRYAPVVAITVVVIMIVAALAFFLGIKPQVDGAAQAIDRQDDVKANITKIEADSASIDDAAAQLAQVPDLTEATTLNAPSNMDLATFQTRLDKAIRSSKTELVAVEVRTPTEVTPWTLDVAALPSTGVAGYFETGPETRLPGEPALAEPYEPVVKPAAADAETGATIVRMDIQIKVVGHPGEVQALLKTLADPEQRLFQVFDVKDEAKQETDTPEKGAAPYTDGDVFMTISGALYLLSPDYTIIDEDELVPSKLPSTSPFVEPDDFIEQPGSK